MAAARDTEPGATGTHIDGAQLATWRALLNAHSRVTRRIESDLREAGLPPLGWYDVLWPLLRAPSGRLRINELAEEVVLSRTGMVRLVDRIERAGLLRREPVPEDRRGTYAAITDEGVETLRRMWPVYERGIREYFLEPVGGGAKAVRQALERVGSG